MENWIIFTKIAVLFYCIFQYYNYGLKSTSQIVIFMLIYISANIIIYIISRKNIVKIVLILIMLMVVMAFHYINPVFICLLPISIFEFICCVNINAVKLANLFVILIPVRFLSSYMATQYLMLAFFSYIINFVLRDYWKRINIVVEENDSMKEKVYNMTLKLNRNSRYDERIRYVSRLEERNRISQEIHDKIGHSMSGSIIQLEAAKLFLDRDLDKSRDIIQKVIEILRESTEDIRASLKNTKPTVDQIGINRLKLMLEQFSMKNNINTVLIHNGIMERISQMQWRAIQDNIYESLTNALKYSGASFISVKINALNKFVKVEIKDNGKGSSIIKKGIGIIGMEERCSNIYGQLIVDGSKGFSVIMILPFRE